MKVNADFDRTVVVNTSEIDWVASPMPGVERRMLDRIGEEVARATTIVRFAPDSAFSPHTHDGGEEYLVLDGVFQDEHGDFPAGTYVRNPPTSRHTPRSAPGCTIFVKLHQFDPADRTYTRIETNKTAAVALAGCPGVKVLPLFADGRETVRIETWAPGTEIEMDPEGGLELLVLSGGFQMRDRQLSTHGWLRLPIGKAFSAVAGKDGARVWMKSGHLRFVGAPGKG